MIYFSIMALLRLESPSQYVSRTKKTRTNYEIKEEKGRIWLKVGPKAHENILSNFMGSGSGNLMYKYFENPSCSRTHYFYDEESKYLFLVLD